MKKYLFTLLLLVYANAHASTSVEVTENETAVRFYKFGEAVRHGMDKKGETEEGFKTRANTEIQPQGSEQLPEYYPLYKTFIEYIISSHEDLICKTQEFVGLHKIHGSEEEKMLVDIDLDPKGYEHVYGFKNGVYPYKNIYPTECQHFDEYRDLWNTLREKFSTHQTDRDNFPQYVKATARFMVWYKFNSEASLRKLDSLEEKILNLLKDRVLEIPTPATQQ